MSTFETAETQIPQTDLREAFIEDPSVFAAQAVAHEVRFGWRDQLANSRIGRTAATLALTAGFGGGGEMALATPARAALYPANGCVDAGLNGSGGIALSFGETQSPMYLTTNIQSVDYQINKPDGYCQSQGYSREIDVFEEIEKPDRSGFTTNTGTWVYDGMGANQQNTSPFPETSNSFYCLNDGQTPLRRLRYTFKMLSTNGGESFYRNTSDIDFPNNLPGNTCSDNTGDIQLEGNIDQQGVIGGSPVGGQTGGTGGSTGGNRTHDLPLIQNRRPRVHKPGLQVQLRGTKTVGPLKNEKFEVTDKSSKNMSETLIVKTVNQTRTWHEKLVAGKTNRQFFNLKFPRLPRGKSSVSRGVLVEAFSNHKLLFKETEYVREQRGAK